MNRNTRILIAGASILVIVAMLVTVTLGTTVVASTTDDGSSVSYECTRKVATTTSTVLGVSEITLGQSVTDNATVKTSFVSNSVPSGTVTFYVMEPGSNTWKVITSAVTLVNGQAVSSSYTPATVGTYYFKAVYSGSAIYASSASLCTEEKLIVKQPTPSSVSTTTVTELDSSSAVVYQTVTDTATVTATNGVYPTGTVNFWVYYAGNDTTWYYANDVPLVDGEASAQFVPAAVGSYELGADFVGTGLYTNSQSVYGTESLTVSVIGSSIETDLGVTIITLGQTVTDNVTVAGMGGDVAAPSGTVDFQVLVNGVWTTYSTETLSADAAGNGVATSDPCPLEYLSDAGTYYFRAVYYGDAIYGTLTSDNEAEILAIDQATPSVSTDLGTTTITLGQSVNDIAYVTGMDGVSAPTGTVDFWVYYAGNDTTWFYDNGVALVNGVATSTDFLPAATGDYSFGAVYSGDDNYMSAESAADSELLTVTSCNCDCHGKMITLGQSVTDNATVSSGLSSDFPTPTGTVDFYVYYEGNNSEWCFSNGVELVNGVATSGWFTPTETGQYYFKAVYSGDDNYEGSSDSYENEPMCVLPASTSTSTELSTTTSITPLESVTDTAYVTTTLGSEFPVPTGTVSFWVYDSNNGSTWFYCNDVALVNGEATSTAFTPYEVGQFYFGAVYSGDANYKTSSSDPQSEPLTVVKLTTSIVTDLGVTEITLGQTVTDNVTVAGVSTKLPTPSGTVEFQVLYNGVWTTYSTATLSADGINGVATSTPCPLQYLSATGTYYFRAVYLGDATYNAMTSDNEAEALIVNPAEPSVTTDLGITEITLGQSVTDNATVTGLGGVFPVPTGTVSFWVYDSNNNSMWFYSNDVALDANGEATSAVFTPTEAGDYNFGAVYSGDVNYLSSASYPCDEPLTVNPATPSVTTSLGIEIITLGQSVTDNVTVTGLGGDFPVPTGTVSFWVTFTGANGTHTWFYCNDVALDANGQAVSTVFTPHAAGSYHFGAVYSGDANYVGSHSDPTSEPLTVKKASTTTTTDLDMQTRE